MMATIRFSGKGILLDIEGTTSSISFVYDVLFPFARAEAAAFLQAQWNNPGVASAIRQMAKDAGYGGIAAWLGESETLAAIATVLAEMNRLMDADAKRTGLKELQGLIWGSGFRDKRLQSHVYADVAPAIRAWRDANIDVRIYSSGSVAAQKLFFGHTIVGNLLDKLNGHYDTQTGAKRDPESYRKIAADFKYQSTDLLYLSDVVAELDAAREAGWNTGLLVRPGNHPQPTGHPHPLLNSFAEIEVVGK